MGQAMRSCPLAHPVAYRRCVASASGWSPAMRPSMCQACTVRASISHSTRHQPCRRTAVETVFRPHSDVQRARRQRAAPAATAPPSRLRCAPRARLAVGRSRERMRGAETEGQIKGVARRAPEIQSARGFAAAPRGRSRVPCRHGNPHGSGVCRVPFAIAHAVVRSGLRYGRT